MFSEIAFQLLLVLFQHSQSIHTSPMVISSLGFTLQSPLLQCCPKYMARLYLGEENTERVELVSLHFIQISK